MEKPIVILTGPTAVGKTEVAVNLAKRLNTEIISADSMQIYKYMDIGTAKPTPEERKGVKFNLIDIIEPDEPFSVAQFKAQAEEIIQRLLQEGKVPLIVGGTRLYIKSLTDGLFKGPGSDEGIRSRLTQEAQRFGPEHLYKKLIQVDREKAERLHPNDLKRIIRALEVYELAGKPISLFQKQTQSPPYQATKIALMRERPDLYHRIEARVNEMIKRGLIEEVKSLLKRGYDESLNSMQGLGYKEVIGYLKGEHDLSETIRLIKRNSKHFARRQLIWLRREKNLYYFIDIKPSDSLNEVTEKALEILKRNSALR